MADDDVENFFVFHSDFVASLLLTSRNEKCPTYTNCTTKGFLDPVKRAWNKKFQTFWQALLMSLPRKRSSKLQNTSYTSIYTSPRG